MRQSAGKPAVVMGEKQSFASRFNFSKKNFIIMAIVFALIGGFLIWRSFALSPTIATLEAERMVLPTGSSAVSDTGASGGQAVKMTANGTMSGTVQLPAQATSLSITMKGKKCSGKWPKASVQIDGSTALSSTSASSISWRTYTASASIASGAHTVTIVAANVNTCRNLSIDLVTFYGAAQTTPSPTVSLNTSPSSVTAGGSSTLTWSSANASSCTASGAWSGSKATSGSTSTGALNAGSTYNLSCTGANGTASASTTVAVTSSTTTPSTIQAGAFIPLSGDRGADVDNFTKLVGVMPKTVMTYRDWAYQLIYSGELNPYVTRGITPVITWEPTSVPLKSIAAGNYDSYIQASAKQAASFGQPLYIRFAHEMNGRWEPWGVNVNGNTAADYVAAWKRVVTIFRQNGASNVKWVWCPNVIGTTSPDFTPLFPGDDWVDVVGLDGYNSSSTDGSPWLSFDQVFNASYAKITSISARPVQISETGSVEVGGSKADWIRQAYLTDIPKKYPRIRSIYWFNKNQPPDWRVDTSTSSLAAYREVVASPLYKQ